VAKSSVHCILLTLERCGYVRRHERTSRYTLALKLFGLANAALNGLELRERATPFLRALAERNHLTVHMAILEGNEPLLVEKVEPPGVVRLATWVGKRMDVHCTALGKVLASILPEEELTELIRKRPLIRHNDSTIVSLKKLKEDLARVRVLGYAVDDEEEEIGMRCVGCAVLDPDGKTVAAISVTGTTDQVTHENLPVLSAELKTAASALTESLKLHAEHAER
jgi:DNA-binding IclR family transcriptional regulator